MKLELSEIKLIKRALSEDIGRGDLFSLIARDTVKTARIISKSEGIFAGEIYLEEIAKIMGLELVLSKRDGDILAVKDEIATLKGSEANLLKTERTALNFIQHVSGIATKTYEMAILIKDLNVAFLDTRKTRPGLRVLEKYAVRCGGGQNHRLGLDDCLMIKDTHLAGVNNLKDFVKRARAKLPFTSKIEMECDSFAQVQEAVAAGIDIVMLDNMSPAACADIVKWRDENKHKVLLEASGNIDKSSIRAYALSGVDALSSGSSIHQATWLDFSMRM